MFKHKILTLFFIGFANFQLFVQAGNGDSKPSDVWIPTPIESPVSSPEPSPKETWVPLMSLISDESSSDEESVPSSSKATTSVVKKPKDPATMKDLLKKSKVKSMEKSNSSKAEEKTDTKTKTSTKKSKNGQK
ncbi:uncharacterized protein LOC116346068 [Contarinia nasturtii]|uniref:uncharacterized protein LOC116346068 n=1 Tax=Contarinia nasturtii TaxID=265458 RepID=UPI0012D4BC6F|nr:uncharacterized protein LOC116346068 [Contarinia nasturtii]